MRSLAMDLIAVLLFAILARAAHGGMSILAILDTFWPFALGTLVGAAFIKHLNLYGPSSMGGTVSWVTTVVAGLGIWAIRNGEIPHWSFILVATLTSALLLFGWRATNSIAVKRAQK